MVMFDKPLYKEDCMAWVHGPVYEEVYDLFKDFKFNPIEDNRFAILKERFEELDNQLNHLSKRLKHTKEQMEILQSRLPAK